MKKIINLFVFLVLFYPFCIIAGLIFHLFRKLKIIHVLHWERFPRWQRNLILVSNHPSMLETFLLPLLFFHQYFFHPLKYIPWSTPDQKNFDNPWYWFWIKPRIIPIPRGNKIEEAKSLATMKKILNSKGIIILFAEGGRTYKGNKFCYSITGKRIRTLKNGVSRLVSETKATILPIWVEGTEKVLPNLSNKLFSFPRFGHKVVIKIGQILESQKFANKNKEEIIKIVTNALLNLADER